MIKPGEIQKKAREVGVRDQQIEKDYILSWILKGLAQHLHLSKLLVFKGGTVLKKIYFKDYRFSEDLDFTMLNDEVSNENILKWFSDLFEYVREEANIQLELSNYNEHNDGGINFYLTYTGSLGGQSSGKKVKVDISRNEKLVFDPILKNVIITYSDLQDHDLLCYSLEEVLLEKMRSVIQRMQARDFYDLWYLLEIIEIDASFYINEFGKKCANKNIKPNEFLGKLIERLPQYKGRWLNSLNEQIKDLPDFDTTEREVMRRLKKIRELSD